MYPMPSKEGASANREPDSSDINESMVALVETSPPHAEYIHLESV